MVNEQYLTAEQVAELLHVKPATVKGWRWLKTYPLKYVKIGRVILYRRSDVDEFMATMANQTK
jgi:excisionase family DNA binding protein